MQQFNKELKQKREKLQKIKDNVTIDRLKDLNLTIRVIDQLLTKYPNQKTNYPDIFLEEYEFLKKYKFSKQSKIEENFLNKILVLE